MKNNDGIWALGGISLAILMGSISLSSSWDKPKATTQPQKEAIEMRISEVDAGWDGMRYCGMPNSNTFSLSHLGQNAVNYYYPSEAKEIHFFSGDYEVLTVSPEKIKLREVTPETKNTNEITRGVGFR